MSEFSDSSNEHDPGSNREELYDPFNTLQWAVLGVLADNYKKQSERVGKIRKCIRPLGKLCLAAGATGLGLGTIDLLAKTKTLPEALLSTAGLACLATGGILTRANKIASKYERNFTTSSLSFRAMKARRISDGVVFDRVLSKDDVREGMLSVANGESGMVKVRGGDIKSALRLPGAPLAETTLEFTETFDCISRISQDITSSGNTATEEELIALGNSEYARRSRAEEYYKQHMNPGNL